MPFKFNPLTGTLDLVNAPLAGTVIGVPPTDITAIARWADTSGNTIENSLAQVQDGGALQAQALLTNRIIAEIVLVPTNYSMLASNIEIEDGELVIDQDAEVVIL